LRYKVLLVMKENKYLDDLSEIKDLMNKSSRFLSLSGMSGILAGTYALIGAFIAYGLIKDYTIEPSATVNNLRMQLFIIAFLVFVATILTGLFLSSRKAKKTGMPIWDVTAKNLLISFIVPLSVGGIFGLILVKQAYFGLVAPITLIFYGLSLINASKYTYGTVYYLGLAEVIIGLLAAIYPGNGLYFWAFGFGVLHILYGTIMYFKYDKN